MFSRGLCARCAIELFREIPARRRVGLHRAHERRAALERGGTPMGPYDILIAAQARRRRAALITANPREFARVPRLKTEDWTAA